MIKRIKDIFNLIIYGTGKKDIVQNKRILNSQNKHAVKGFSPKRTKSLLTIIEDHEAEAKSGFTSRLSSFFGRKRNATPNKKLFLKWLKRSKHLGGDTDKIEKLWQDHLARKQRILDFEEKSFQEHH